jgi:microtubule-associated protein-like 1/2
MNGSRGTTITCLEFNKNGNILTGDSEGKITVWSISNKDGSYVPEKEVQAHEKSVTSLLMIPEGSLVSGSEADRRISAWDPFSFNLLTETKVQENHFF